MGKKRKEREEGGEEVAHRSLLWLGPKRKKKNLTLEATRSLQALIIGLIEDLYPQKTYHDQEKTEKEIALLIASGADINANVDARDKKSDTLLLHALKGNATFDLLITLVKFGALVKEPRAYLDVGLSDTTSLRLITDLALTETFPAPLIKGSKDGSLKFFDHTDHKEKTITELREEGAKLVGEVVGDRGLKPKR